MASQQYKAFAATAPGLEEPLVDELRQLGLRSKKEPGGASFSTDAEGLYAVNLFSHLAGRVTVEVARAKADNLQTLARGAQNAGWKRYVWPGQPVEVKATTSGARLRNRAAVANKVSLAIKDALRGPRLPGPRPPRTPANVHVHVDGVSARISVDASGELLHRRGWRQATAKAPIRENYAATILRLAEWMPGEPLVDPMCGSGTFCIEAATIAAGRAPGGERSFGFELWPSFDKSLMDGLRREARSAEPLAEGGLFLAADRDAGAVKATSSNARRAGVAGMLQIRQESFGKLEAPASTGLLVANPPYGQRVGEGGSDWRAFSRILRERWQGWRVAVVVPPLAKRALMSAGLEQVADFKTGGIPVVVLVGEIARNR